MGQRLNLEITYKGECVANAYYHWSGFSDSALNTILDACCAYEKDFAVDKESATILAVLMLEATGAGLKKKKFLFTRNYARQMILNIRQGLMGITDGSVFQKKAWEKQDAVRNQIRQLRFLIKNA